MCLCKCFCLDTFSLFPMIPMILEGHQRLIGKSGRFETTNQGLVENGLSLIPVDWKWRYTLWRLTKPHDFEDVLGIGTRLSNRMWMERDAMSQSEWKDKQKKDRTTRVVVRCNSGNISLPMASLGHWSETWSSEAPRLIRTMVRNPFDFPSMGGDDSNWFTQKKCVPPPVLSELINPMNCSLYPP